MDEGGIGVDGTREMDEDEKETAAMMMSIFTFRGAQKDPVATCLVCVQELRSGATAGVSALRGNWISPEGVIELQ